MPAVPFSQRLRQARETYGTSKRLLGLVWNLDRPLFAAFTVAVAIPGIIPFANAYIYKLIIDAVIDGLAADAIDRDRLTTLILARIITYFLSDTAFNVQNYVERLLWTKIPIRINELIFTKIASLDLEHLESAAFRTLLERTDERYRVQNQISSMLYAFQSFIQLSIALVAILQLNWLLIFAVVLITIPEFIYQLYESQAGWSIWNWHSPLKKRFTYLSGLLQNIDEVKEIKLFRLSPVFIREAQELQEKYYRENARLSGKTFLFQLCFNALSTVLFIGVELYVITRVFIGRLTVGDISFYTQIVSNFQNGLGGLLRNANAVFENSLYIRSIFELLDTPPILKTPEHPESLTSASPPLIEFRNVSFRYPGAEKDTLTGFSLTIQPGEKIALVGENGAGKSTIIKLLARLYDVTEGAILIDGKDLRSLDIPDWHRHIGILFQDFNRYHDTVRNNILYGDIEGRSAEHIETASRDAGAEPVIAGLAGRYEQMLGKTFDEGMELSTGQWQKIALARAYFRNAPVLVLDEPTAAIDARAEAEIFERVEQLSRDKTVILISHRFSTVRMANRIIVINEGSILEQGSHEELLVKNGLYAELFLLQAKGYA